LILFVIVIIVLFILPSFVSYPQYLTIPENFKIAPLPSYASQILMMLGLPQEWMYVPAIIYLFILPFAAIYTLVWAFLQSLGIFANVSSSVNRILAFIIAFLTIPFGLFVKFVWILFVFMGGWSVVIFAATFILGVFYRGAGIALKQQVEYRKHLKKEKDALKAEIAALEEAFKSGMANKMKEEAARALRGVLSLSAVSARSRGLAEEIVAEQTEEGVKSKMEELIKQLKKDTGE
jgi:hypothetical protein